MQPQSCLLYVWFIGCSLNMFGGFNESTCQMCPANSTSKGGFLITNCDCGAGFAMQNSQCIGKSWLIGTFKNGLSTSTSSLLVLVSN